MQEQQTRFVTDADDWAIIQLFRAINGLLPEQQAQSA